MRLKYRKSRLIIYKCYLEFVLLVIIALDFFILMFLNVYFELISFFKNIDFLVGLNENFFQGGYRDPVTLYLKSF